MPTGNIPELEANNRFIVPLKYFQSKIYADGGAIVLRKYLMNVSLYYRGFTDSKVPDNKNFKQMFLLHDLTIVQLQTRLRLALLTVWTTVTVDGFID